MDKGLTQVQLGRRVGRHQSVISRWETEALAMTLDDLVAVTTALGIDADEVLLGCHVPAQVRHRSSRSRPLRRRRAIGRRLAAARTVAGLDPVSVWQCTAITPYRLGVLEGGGDVTLAELQLLVSVLGTSVYELAPREASSNS